MPSDNCAVLGCGSCRRTKGLGIWKLPAPKDEASKKWRQDWLCQITRPARGGGKTASVRSRGQQEVEARLALSDHEASKKWRQDWLCQITRARESDYGFKLLLANDRVFNCEKHFDPGDIEICK